MKYKILWAVYFIPHALVVLLCWYSNPIACLFPSRQPNGRDKLWGVFNLWSTDDFPTDEGWYGRYFRGDYPSVEQQTNYNNSALLRYWYRLKWLTRNTGYGWTYLLFSIPKGKGFQIHKSVPITFWFFGFKYNDLFIGWKPHDGMDRLTYAQGVLRLKRVKTY